MDGLSVLIVEDDWLVADAIERQVDEIGGWVVGPVASVAEAMLALSRAMPDLALLDINLGRETSYAIADALAARGTPFIFVTAYDRSILPDRFAKRPLLSKPLSSAELRKELVEIGLAHRSTSADATHGQQR
ncbi:response regulator [Roseomonas hellenica]|uniref:Response regulator n=1 Tax=Plastoroseomonas hellenica TaxID=2687306 RepID=A0ABS5EWU2_9PROT|nr:response regulator [Plastoroseomonas hellenica]MBR0664751.1 response regulator [Plastoroseomonas hellenica]